jgi:hypothetical protein
MIIATHLRAAARRTAAGAGKNADDDPHEPCKARWTPREAARNDANRPKLTEKDAAPIGGPRGRRVSEDKFVVFLAI